MVIVAILVRSRGAAVHVCMLRETVSVLCVCSLCRPLEASTVCSNCWAAVKELEISYQNDIMKKP